MSFAQPQLPYDQAALEPHISRKTLEFHYGKHHLTYWKNLNGLAAGTPVEKQSLEEVVKTASGKLFNQAAQTWNHSFYWSSMKPNPSNAANPPTGAIAEKINASFGSFEEFKKQFSEAAGGHFGSGWAWLILKPDGKLAIHQTHDAGCPLQDKSGVPILTCDVWEHAYYLDYQNARPNYIAAWWALVNWDFANQNLAKH